nr:uncharacterized protein LOC127339009 [Lolium perenne]
MNPEQVKTLKYEARMLKPTIPFYVCTMKEGNTLEGKAKMYFTRKFSKAYISKNLDLPANVKVFSNKESCGKVRMIMDKGKATGAQITTNWRVVVENTRMEINDIFIFRFRVSAKDGLLLFVKELK